MAKRSLKSRVVAQRGSKNTKSDNFLHVNVKRLSFGFQVSFFRRYISQQKSGNILYYKQQNIKMSQLKCLLHLTELEGVHLSEEKVSSTVLCVEKKAVNTKEIFLRKWVFFFQMDVRKKPRTEVYNIFSLDCINSNTN